MADGDFRALAAHLRAWDGRRRQAELLVWLPRAAAVALGLAVILALVARVRPLLTRGEVALAAVALALAALAVVATVVYAQRRSPAEQARFADRLFGLRERATTAVEIHDGRLTAPPELTARQLQDTLDAAATVDMARQLPLVARPQDWLPALALFVALAIILQLPNAQEGLLLQQRAAATAIAEQVAALEGLAEEIAANEALTAEQQSALQQPLEQALATLSEPGVSQAEAVAVLSQAEAELRELGQEFDHAAMSAAVADAAAALGEAGAAAELAAALQAAQAGQAATAAGELADTLPQLDAAEQQALAEQLAGAAAALEGTDETLSEPLARAAAALESGDTAAAQEALRDAAGELAAQARAGEAATQAGAAADQLGAARQAVASAGQQSQATAQGGEASEGEGGEGAQSGQGSNATGGQGAEAGGAGETGGEGQGSATGGPSAGGGHVESVFVPSPLDLSGQGADVELDVQCLGSPDECGPSGEGQPVDPNRPRGGSVVPYDQVFGDFRDAAFEALPSSGIPLGLQGLVRDYFSALEP